jgi:hypothetical protein
LLLVQYADLVAQLPGLGRVLAVGHGAELLELIQRLCAQVAVAQQFGDPLDRRLLCGGRTRRSLEDRVHELRGQLLAGDLIDQLEDLVGPRQRRLTLTV